MKERFESEPKQRLVPISEAGLLGSSFYWTRYEDYGLTKEELVETGMADEQVYVDNEIMPALVEVDAELQKRNWRLYLREGYRSPELYQLLYKKRVEKFGQEMTDKLLNMEDMPHASGRAVDVSIWDEETDSEIKLRRTEDGPESLIYGFYKDAEDPAGQRCGELQEYLVGLMQSHGFGLGKRNEFFHFNYQPETESDSGDQADIV